MLFYTLIFEAFEIKEHNTEIIIALTVLVLAPPWSPLMPGVFHDLLITPSIAFELTVIDEATAYAVLLHGFQLVVLLALDMWGFSQMNMKVSELWPKHTAGMGVVDGRGRRTGLGWSSQ